MGSEGAFLLSGVVFGLSAGLSPGPLLALVVSETLRHGVKEGVKVSLAPLLTDVPIVSVTLFLLARLSDMQPVLGAVSLLGGLFLGYLGWESLRYSAGPPRGGPAESRSMRKGLSVNLLNPHVYMFWFAIGAPTVLKAVETGLRAVVLFVAGFYVLLVGSKILVALLVGRFGRFLESTAYALAIRFLGIALLGFAALFLRDGLRAFGAL